ncbi:hypothetical protein D3C75_1272960 [compost metagenome]
MNAAETTALSVTLALAVSVALSAAMAEMDSREAAAAAAMRREGRIFMDSQRQSARFTV